MPQGGFTLDQSRIGATGIGKSVQITVHIGVGQHGFAMLGHIGKNIAQRIAVGIYRTVTQSLIKQQKISEARPNIGFDIHVPLFLCTLSATSPSAHILCSVAFLGAYGLMCCTRASYPHKLGMRRAGRACEVDSLLFFPVFAGMKSKPHLLQGAKWTPPKE